MNKEKKKTVEKEFTCDHCDGTGQKYYTRGWRIDVEDCSECDGKGKFSLEIRDKRKNSKHKKLVKLPNRL